MGLSILVGLVAGLGAIAFYIATRAAEHYALGVIGGYDAVPHPAGEAAISWLPIISAPFRPWLLLIIPTVGGLLSGLLVYTLAPEAEGHGTDAVIDALVEVFEPGDIIVDGGNALFTDTIRREKAVRERGLVAHVSLSDEVDSAVAFVIIEQHSGDAQADPGLARDAGAVSPDARATDRREG